MRRPPPAGAIEQREDGSRNPLRHNREPSSSGQLLALTQTGESGSQTATNVSRLVERSLTSLPIHRKNAEEDCKHEEGSPREGRRDVHHAAPGDLLPPALRPPGQAELGLGPGPGPSKVTSPSFSHPSRSLCRLQMVLYADWDTPALKLEFHGSTSSSRTLLGAGRTKEGRESPRVGSDLFRLTIMNCVQNNGCDWLAAHY